MSIAVACVCGKRGWVKERRAGSSMRCPGCGGSVSVPPAASLGVVDTSEAPSEPAARLPRPLLFGIGACWIVFLGFGTWLLVAPEAAPSASLPDKALVRSEAPPVRISEAVPAQPIATPELLAVSAETERVEAERDSIAEKHRNLSPTEIVRAARGFLRQGEGARCLATLNVMQWLEPDDPRVARMRVQLESLHRGYIDREVEIISYTIYFVAELRKTGNELTIEEFLDGMYAVHPDRKHGPPNGEKFAESAAIYITLIIYEDKKAAHQ
jgi:hypothetical protein